MCLCLGVPFVFFFYSRSNSGYNVASNVADNVAHHSGSGLTNLTTLLFTFLHSLSPFCREKLNESMRASFNPFSEQSDIMDAHLTEVENKNELLGDIFNLSASRLFC